MKYTIVFFLILVNLGCAGNKVTLSEHNVGSGDVVSLSYPAEYRSASILFRPSKDTAVTKLISDKIIEINNLVKSSETYHDDFVKLTTQIAIITQSTAVPIIIAEPPSQVSRDINLDLEGSLDKLEIGKLTIDSTTQKLFDVTSQNLVIRDALYRLNEVYLMNDSMSEVVYKAIFFEILETAKGISTSE